MSMRIKKATSFKPKGPGKRPAPSSAQSSARPSVERQSQPPVPSTRPIETITIPDQDGASKGPREPAIEPTPRPKPLNPAVQDPTILDSNLPADNPRKRKEGPGNGEAHAAEKRARVDVAGGSTRTKESQNAMEGVVDLTADIGRPPTEIHGPTHDSHAESAASRQIQAGHEATWPVPEVDPRSRPATPEIRQDNPSSIYPDPELSGIHVSGTVGPRATSSAEPQAAFAVPTATFNPDGTVSSNVIQDASLNPDGSARALSIPSQTAPPRTAPKKRAPPKNPRKRRAEAPGTQAEDDDENDNLSDIRATIEMNLQGRRADKEASRKEKQQQKQKVKRDKRKKTKPKKRADTPEGGEDIEVDSSVMPMGELCKDLKIGRKFSKSDEIKAKLDAKKEADKLRRFRKAHPELAGNVEGAEGEDGRSEAAQDGAHAEAETESAASNNHIVPQTRRDATGRLMFDDQSLQVNLHERANAARGNVVIAEAIEENDFTKRVTCASHLKRETVEDWGPKDTITFYQGIRIFGTDFNSISKLFGGLRSRKQIKLKYKWEDRVNPRKLTRASQGEPEDVDLEQEYKVKIEESFGGEMQEVYEIKAELEALAEKAAEKEAEEAAARAEETRKKKEMIKARSGRAQGILRSIGDEPENEGQSEGQRQIGRVAGGSQAREASAPPPKPRKRAAPKSKKNPHSGGNVGTEEIVSLLPSIEVE